MFTVLLTTSGTGSRLGELTKTTNKTLVPINGRPTIDYIIDNYPTDTRFVVTLGYRGAQVREYLEKQYPEKNIIFVEVDPYTGDGSSLGYSMLCARSLITTPFVFHACDTIVTDPIPDPNLGNWIMGYKMDDSAQYRTLNIQNEEVISINDKGAHNFDYIHIGLPGFKDVELFWRCLEDAYQTDIHNQALNDTDAINRMITAGSRFRFIPSTTWFDTGNPEALERTQTLLKKSQKDNDQIL